MVSDRFKRIRRMILRRALLAPFIIIMIVCGTLVYYFSVDLRDNVTCRLTCMANDHRRLIEQFLKERSFDLQCATNSNSFNELTHDGRLTEVLAQLQEGSHAFLDLGVFDKDGNHVAYVGPYNLKGKNYAETKWFSAVRKKSPYISDVFLGYRDTPHFIIAVRRGEGDGTWYLRATIDTFYFNDLVENVRIRKTGEAYIVNHEGVFQTRRRSGGAFMELDPDSNLYRIDNKTDVSFFSASNQEGERYLYAAGLLPQTGWVLVVRQEFSEAYAPLISAVIIAVVLIICGGAVVVIMAFILASGVANRLTIADMEKQEISTQLIMAGKLAEVGEMSAGVAHEINNPLQIMESERTMLNDILEEIETGHGVLDEENMSLLNDSVEQIAVQINRCKLITHGLLKFARKSEPLFQAVDLKQFTQEVVSMIEREAELENIRIVQKFDADLPKIMADPNQFQQVLLNLLNNAIDALKAKHGGEIRVTSVRQDDSIAISVADNGCGIPTDKMEKIFLPFYTTKPVGQGTGLGLSTCYGIVERMGGKISVNSELNVGTAFTVWLPLAENNDIEKAGK